VIPGSACLASAIEDALGVRISAMPVSPSDLFELLASDPERTRKGSR